jgi:hypothetical protein
MRRNLRVGLSALMLTALACEPVIAIGWRELFIVFVLMAFLFGRPVYRFIRRIEVHREQKQEDKTSIPK